MNSWALPNFELREPENWEMPLWRCFKIMIISSRGCCYWEKLPQAKDVWAKNVPWLLCASPCLTVHAEAWFLCSGLFSGSYQQWAMVRWYHPWRERRPVYCLLQAVTSWSSVVFYKDIARCPCKCLLPVSCHASFPWPKSCGFINCPSNSHRLAYYLAQTRVRVCSCTHTHTHYRHYHQPTAINEKEQGEAYGRVWRPEREGGNNVITLWSRKLK